MPQSDIKFPQIVVNIGEDGYQHGRYYCEVELAEMEWLKMDAGELICRVARHSVSCVLIRTIYHRRAASALFAESGFGYA